MADNKKDIEFRVDSLLQQWGRWASSNPVSTCYPSQTPFRRLQGSSVGSLPLDTELALKIDLAVSELKHVNKTAKEVVELYYVCNINLRNMKEYKIDYHKARELRKVALGYCMGRLFEHVAV